MRGGYFANMPLLAMIGCQGPKGDQGPPGQPGPAGPAGTNGTNGANGTTPDGGVPPQSVNCRPAEAFCVGNRIATCTLSGADAVVGDDCSASGTATNPSMCVTSGCNGGAKACCRQQKPVCAWNWTAPFSSSGQRYAFDGTDYCSLATTCPQDASFYVTWLESPGVCPRVSRQVAVTFDKTKLAVGASVTLPATGVSVYAYDTESGQPQVTCTSWTGTLRFDSDVPAWSITVNATCSETGKSTLQLAGTVSGNQ